MKQENIQEMKKGENDRAPYHRPQAPRYSPWDVGELKSSGKFL